MSMVVESTNLAGSLPFSFQATKDLENGAIIGKGSLVTNETEIYTALDDYSDGMYLVANPAWSYENGVTKQNEESYVNKAGVSFRAYKLNKNNKFKIYNIDTVFAKGDKIKYDSSTGKYVVDSGSDPELEVVHVEEVGFPYCIGDHGVRLVGDTDNNYGYAIGQKTTKYTVQVIK